MMGYQEKDILRIAKRINNSKRPYLLVNPIQAKHMPVAPSKALQMMECLGGLVAKRCGDSRLVIGFAETATAIGAVVAKTISDECVYIHTTREDVKKAKGYVYFTEEHSHATEQKIVSDDLHSYFSGTDTVIFVDDEFSTGKTLINMVNRLRECCPAFARKRIIAASLINRLSEDNLNKWSNEGIESVCLLKLPNVDYSPSIDSLEVAAASLPSSGNAHNYYDMVITRNLPDPRAGVVISDYYKSCIEKAAIISRNCNLTNKNVLILGTEECMLPALLIGKAIEDAEGVSSIRCHATTRSPIGTSGEPGYPITSGYRVHSFYNAQRDTFIYNLQPYDVVVIVSDAKGSYNLGLNELSKILKDTGCEKIICLAGVEDV